jgi:hypothetical protein
MMCDVPTPPTTHATLTAQALYAKLQKLGEDIQMQHSIITAQKETILKSRQKACNLNIQKVEPPDTTHLVHTHAGTVLQHRAMLIKHYELIQQHKQMVKEQGQHVQNLTSTLLNIQQETTVVDELMNTKMAENRFQSPQPPPPPPPPRPPCPDGPSTRNGKTTRRKSKNQNVDRIITMENNPNASPDTSVIPYNTPNTENTKLEDSPEDGSGEVTTITTTSTTTTTTPTSSTTETLTISSICTPTSMTTTTTTTTTTTSPPPPLVSSDDTPLPLSP